MGNVLRGWAGVLVVGALLLAPAAGFAQNNAYEVPPPGVVFPWPFGHPRYEDGGFYGFGEFLTVKQTNPIKQQLLAVRGLVDWDGSIHAALGIPGGPGSFLGSGGAALDAEDASGPATYQPGFAFGFGWRFQSGVAVEFTWKHLWDAKYSAVATLGILNNPGTFLENTFLTSPVYNFPAEFAGPGNQVGIGNNGATFGIWNASTSQQVTFVQRFDQFEVVGRFPLNESETWRSYGTIGPRTIAMWERFSWRVVDQNVAGVANADDVANYSNVVSNRLYGLNCGWGNECYLGTTPLGAISFSADLHAGLYADFVKGRAKYQRGDKAMASSRARNLFTLAPGLEGNFNFHYFPYEGIQFRLGYDVAAYFNTVASPRPVDFNYGGVDPEWAYGITRIFHGFNFGVAFIF